MNAVYDKDRNCEQECQTSNIWIKGHGLIRSGTNAPSRVAVLRPVLSGLHTDDIVSQYIVLDLQKRFKSID